MATAPPQGTLDDQCAELYRSVEELRRVTSQSQARDLKGKEKGAYDLFLYASVLLDDPALQGPPRSRADLVAGAAVLGAYLDLTDSPVAGCQGSLPDGIDQARAACRQAIASARELPLFEGADQDQVVLAGSAESLAVDAAQIVHEVIASCHAAVEKLAAACDELVHRTGETCNALVYRSAETYGAMVQQSAETYRAMVHKSAESFDLLVEQTGRTGARIMQESIEQVAAFRASLDASPAGEPERSDGESATVVVMTTVEERPEEEPAPEQHPAWQHLVSDRLKYVDRGERGEPEAPEGRPDPLGQSPGGRIFFRLLQPKYRGVTRRVLAQEPVDLVDLDLDDLLVEWQSALDSSLREARGSRRRTASREVLDLFQLSGMLSAERGRLTSRAARR